MHQAFQRIFLGDLNYNLSLRLRCFSWLIFRRTALPRTVRFSAVFQERGRGEQIFRGSTLTMLYSYCGWLFAFRTERPEI
jgi:hypothetical protein